MVYVYKEYPKWIKTPEGYEVIVKNGKIKIGDIAGCLNPKGYLKIKINYNQYFAHRLAFLYMTGEWPKEQIGSY